MDYCGCGSVASGKCKSCQVLVCDEHGVNSGAYHRVESRAARRLRLAVDSLVGGMDEYQRAWVRRALRSLDGVRCVPCWESALPVVFENVPSGWPAGPPEFLDDPWPFEMSTRDAAAELARRFKPGRIHVGFRTKMLSGDVVPRHFSEMGWVIGEQGRQGYAGPAADTVSWIRTGSVYLTTSGQVVTVADGKVSVSRPRTVQTYAFPRQENPEFAEWRAAKLADLTGGTSSSHQFWRV